MEILKCKHLLNTSPEEVIEKKYEKIIDGKICFSIESRLVRLVLQETLKRKNLKLGKDEDQVKIIFVNEQSKEIE
ncbi:hypothetical protein [Cetobacterium sp.]|uniref:hypothetical protein n=1 Tax=Cetobacterium sp. TaxID=2071632 RepID=UPI003EE46F34